MKITSKELTDIFQKHVENLFPNKELKPVEITVATNENFGDYQCNFAMINSKIIFLMGMLLKNWKLQDQVS